MLPCKGTDKLVLINKIIRVSMTLIIIIALIVILFWAAKLHNDRQEVDKIESKYERIVERKKELEKQEEEKEAKEREILERAREALQVPFFTGRGGKMNMAIKGLFYRTDDDKEAAKKLGYGDVVYLSKEANNEQDSYAVAVHTREGAHIGYVPKEYSMGMTQLLDLGIEPNCMITKRTSHEIPFLYMDVYYKNWEQEEIDERLECELVEKFKRLGLKETSILRWEHILRNKPKSSETTIAISASRNEYGFEITETLESKNHKVREIRYPYNNNIGKNNYEIAEKLEKGNELEMAIRKYEENIEIEEVIADSAVRLSILYKKVKQYEKIMPMLKTAIEKARKYDDEVEITKLNNRMDMFLKNASFMKKYGGEVNN